MQSLRTRFFALWQVYERVFNLTALMLGFTVDLFLAKRPDSVYDNLLLTFYLCVAATAIVLISARARQQRALIFVLQFCFGGLAGNLLILYGKSGTIGGSLLFIGILLAFALGNEFLKTRYEQLRFNVAIYYFLLLTYCIIAVPTFVLHAIGAQVFLISSATSLGVIAIFLFLLYRFVLRRSEKRQLYEVAGIVLGICLIFNGLYFLNIIPPVPLSLKQVGIYHSLAVLPNDTFLQTGDLYAATYEKPAWYVFWRDTSATFTVRAGGSAYCYSAVFAPGDLSTPVSHRWEQYDAASKRWETRSIVSFPINGGRASGYRGYSVLAPSPGSWRCNVETGRGQLIGRITFDVVEASSTPTLSTTTL